MSEHPEADALTRFRCDFCGSEVARVRRVALDRDYDRLQTPHRVQYACPDCSERKERERSTRPA
jgi:predicted RNA-binding Zn-ribbon protein involved in translation (DUF1610 family)